MSLEENNSVRNLIKARADFFKQIRSFFDGNFGRRQALEVDTPILVSYPPNDANIDIMQVKTKMGDRYLASSPEYLMKRLLAAGSKDIYQLCHVYRDGEYGERHSPFFTMLEWYRLDFSLKMLLNEVLDLIHALQIQTHSITSASYRDRFLKATQLDPLTATSSELIHLLAPSLNNPETLSHDALLDAAFIAFVEPTMAHGTHIISSFLPRHAALAKIVNDEALRFEIYIDGIEVANGYEELNDPIEIKVRFDLWNQDRSTPLVVDPRFLAALSHLPATSGVAVGIDRLLMLHQKGSTLASILPFDYTNS